MSVKIKLDQESVDSMVKGLSDQKWIATCSYIDPETGARCAIGWMVSELGARQMQWAPCSITSLAEETGIADVEDHDDLLALQDLQDEHDLDFARGPDGRTPQQRATGLRKRILHWCLRHGFQFNDPNVEVLP